MAHKSAESAEDAAKVASLAAKKRLGTYVHLLKMVVDQQQEIANQLSQIATTIALANGLKKDESETDGSGSGK